MSIAIRRYEERDVIDVMSIWNKIVEDGEAFPQLEQLAEDEAKRFFGEQNDTTVAVDETDKVLGFYILHPNNVGRCGHIGNASYGVRDGLRRHGIGRLLVSDSLVRGHELGYKILQFNAVVDCNPALALYKELGFIELGTIPGGFNYKDDHYEDIHLMYHLL